MLAFHVFHVYGSELKLASERFVILKEVRLGFNAKKRMQDLEGEVAVCVMKEHGFPTLPLVSFAP